MARKKMKDDGVNMTPMIDVVFQMIIFFVCTIEMEKQALDDSVQLPDSPNAIAVKKKIPGTVTVDLDRKGAISIARVPLSLARFQTVMAKTIAIHGRVVPVVIRADGRTRHDSVRKVMDACKGLGLWKIKFAAIKDKVKKPKK